MSTSAALEDLRLAKTHTPLATFLVLYFKARTACYTSYMEGAEELHSYLTTGGHVPLAIPIVPEDYSLPPMLAPDYELTQLAKVIVGGVHSDPDFDHWLTAIAKMQYAIFTVIVGNSDIRKLI